MPILYSYEVHIAKGASRFGMLLCIHLFICLQIVKGASRFGMLLMWKDV